MVSKYLIEVQKVFFFSNLLVIVCKVTAENNLFLTLLLDLCDSFLQKPLDQVVQDKLYNNAGGVGLTLA